VANDSYWFEGLSYDGSQNGLLLEAIVAYANAAETDTDAAITFSSTASSGFIEFTYGKPTLRLSTYSMFYDTSSYGQAINSTMGNMLDLNDVMSVLSQIQRQGTTDMASRKTWSQSMTC
jgi:hypothetical protein